MSPPTGYGLGIDHPLLAQRTGAGVRVAVIDSGIHVGNPHVRGVTAGVFITSVGEADDFVDRIGHGTAVAAAILEKAPGIDLIVVRVFDHVLTTNAAVLVRAIDWAVEHGCRLINLSLGTTNTRNAAVLQAAVDRAVESRALVVSAREVNSLRVLPGSLSGAVGVLLATDCPRDELRVDNEVLMASGFPRPIPGVAPDRNLQGISFAVANATGFLARVLEACPDVGHAADLHALLVAAASPARRRLRVQPTEATRAE